MCLDHFCVKKPLRFQFYYFNGMEENLNNIFKMLLSFLKLIFNLLQLPFFFTSFFLQNFGNFGSVVLQSQSQQHSKWQLIFQGLFEYEHYKMTDYWGTLSHKKRGLFNSHMLLKDNGVKITIQMRTTQFRSQTRNQSCHRNSTKNRSLFVIDGQTRTSKSIKSLSPVTAHQKIQKFLLFFTT